MIVSRTDPPRFDPGRFGETRREDKSHRFAWMPCGGGAHKCIGMHLGRHEVKAVPHEMLRAYRWSVPAEYRMKGDYVSLPVPVDRAAGATRATPLSGSGRHR